MAPEQDGITQDTPGGLQADASEFTPLSVAWVTRSGLNAFVTRYA